VTQRVEMAALPGHDFVQNSQSEFREIMKNSPDERQRFDVRHQLPHSTVPMLMVWGAKDSFAPSEFAEQLKEKLPNVEFVMLENSGHQAQNDEVDKFNEIAIEFFSTGS
jgi:pimeloyl-ACP methyl ester carboxylesterase